MRGKVSRIPRLHLRERDHPRLCGEKWYQLATSEEIPRITPAYAGKSQKPDGISTLHGDHPRLCGEKQHMKGMLLSELGSPPPMRGKVIAAGEATHNLGITPAYAGKSFNELFPCTPL